MKKTNLSELKQSSSLPPEIFLVVAGELLKISKAKLIADLPNLRLTELQLSKFNKIELELSKGTPLQYVLKKAWFYENQFYVDENVLIPRPETELLIEQAINLLDKNMPSSPAILDIGTGSGCIAVTLKKIFPKSNVSGCDISSKALAVAKKNADLHNVKIEFILGDLFGSINSKFDLICANLPYIAADDKNLLKVADPRLALIGGQDGFEMIERLVRLLPDYLTENGTAILEIGYDQRNKIGLIAKEKKLDIEIINDLNNYARIAVLTSSK